MNKNSFFTKRIINLYIVVFIVIMICFISGILILKYSVEGEKNIPFKLKNINIISTAESDIKQDDKEKWHAGILQKNDIFIILEKNENYKKTDTIKKITLENFEFKKLNNDAEINLYRPKSNDFNYQYSEEYEIKDFLQYEGSLETDIENLLINNQGGTIGLGITESNLGEYDFSTNEKVPSDGTLLAKAGLKTDDIRFTVSFDLIIETGNNNKFKTKIELELPTGNILKEGVSTEEESDLENITFKRIK